MTSVRFSSSSSSTAGGSNSSELTKRPSERPLLPLLSQIAIGMASTSETQMGLNQMKKCQPMNQAAVPHARPRSVTPPNVRMISRQSTPSSLRFCATHFTPWPVMILKTKIVWNHIITGESRVKMTVSSMLLTKVRKRCRRDLKTRPVTTSSSRITSFGRKISVAVSPSRKTPARPAATSFGGSGHFARMVVKMRKRNQSGELT